jgi:hypothetical protein
MQGFRAKENPLSGRDGRFSGDDFSTFGPLSAARPLINRVQQRRAEVIKITKFSR